MKKPSAKIREEIAHLQGQLRQAETREAERIGRMALRAGLGEIEIDETALLAAFEKLASRFRDGKHQSTETKKDTADRTGNSPAKALAARQTEGSTGEA
jgi:hypothetical protein